MRGWVILGIHTANHLAYIDVKPLDTKRRIKSRLYNPMSSTRSSPGLTSLLMFCLLMCLSAYFTFAAVQGDFGIFRRVQVEAEVQTLRAELDALEAEVAEMRNKTRRLSDGYLDLDLLDMQAREILGLMRADEIIIR